MAASKPTFRVCLIFGLYPLIPYRPSGRGDNVTLQLLTAHRAIGNADDLLTSAGTEVPDPQHALAVHGDLQETILCRVCIESSKIVVMIAAKGAVVKESCPLFLDLLKPLLSQDTLLSALFASTDNVSVVTHSIYSLETGS